jgi:8-oxo-dGTP pyrophosphatase MutT (NUDIX family)
LATKKVFRVSVKGILIRKGLVLLLSKPNRTWDLPGGSLGRNETPEYCLVREFLEETGLSADPVGYAGSWVRRRRNSPDVFTVAYICRVAGKAKTIDLSPEHIDARYFSAHEVQRRKMIEGCRQVVLDNLP